MKILYINVIEDHHGWGAEYFVNRGLQELGHTTYCIDFRKDRHHLYQRFLAMPDGDVFFLQRGEYFPRPLIRAVNVPRFFWASELVSRCRDQDRLLQSGLFEHVFVHSNACREACVRNGWTPAERCSVLINGFDPTLHKRLPGIQKDIDVLHVGSVSERRKRFLDSIGQVCRLVSAQTYGTEMVNLINRAKISLNIHSEDFRDTETRVFETLGCGGFLLTERLSSESPFSSNDFGEFETVDEAIDKIRYFLDHEQEREDIADHGHHTALNGHTYRHRAQYLTDVFSSYLTTRPRGTSRLLRKNVSFYAYGLFERSQQTSFGRSFYRLMRSAASRATT
jgi:hypothetical protein